MLFSPIDDLRRARRQPHVGARATTLETRCTRARSWDGVAGMLRAGPGAVFMHPAYVWVWARGPGGGVPAASQGLDHVVACSSTRWLPVEAPATHKVQRVSTRVLGRLEGRRGVAGRLGVPEVVEAHRVDDQLVPASSRRMAAVGTIPSTSSSSISSRSMNSEASGASAPTRQRAVACVARGRSTHVAQAICSSDRVG